MKQIATLVQSIDGDEKEFGVKLRPITTAMRVRFLEVNQQHIEEAEAFDRQGKKLRSSRAEALQSIAELTTEQEAVKESADLKPKERSEKLSRIEQQIAELEAAVVSLDGQIYARRIPALHIGLKYNVMYAQILLDPRGLEVGQKELIASHALSEFWQLQPEEEIEAIAAQFRDGAQS